MQEHLENIKHGSVISCQIIKGYFINLLKPNINTSEQINQDGFKLQKQF